MSERARAPAPATSLTFTIGGEPYTPTLDVHEYTWKVNGLDIFHPDGLDIPRRGFYFAGILSGMRCQVTIMDDKGAAPEYVKHLLQTHKAMSKERRPDVLQRMQKELDTWTTMPTAKPAGALTPESKLPPVHIDPKTGAEVR